MSKARARLSNQPCIYMQDFIYVTILLSNDSHEHSLYRLPQEIIATYQVACIRGSAVIRMTSLRLLPRYYTS